MSEKDVPPNDDPEREQPAEIILPDGSIPAETAATEREKQRKSEDEEFVPVIIKRTDETRRHPDDALDNAIREGLEQLNRPAISLTFASIAAGVTVGFSAMAVAVILAATEEFTSSE